MAADRIAIFAVSATTLYPRSAERCPPQVSIDPSMELLARIFDELESKGWVCMLKWDGERPSRTRTIVVSHAASERLFRGDFSTFEEAGEALQEWLLQQARIDDD